MAKSTRQAPLNRSKPATSKPAAKTRKKKPDSYWATVIESTGTDELESLMPNEVHGMHRASIRRRIY